MWEVQMDSVNPYEKVQRMLKNERKRQRIIEEKQIREEGERKRKEAVKKYMKEMYGEEGPWARQRGEQREVCGIERNVRTGPWARQRG